MVRQKEFQVQNCGSKTLRKLESEQVRSSFDYNRIWSGTLLVRKENTHRLISNILKAIIQ